MEMSTQYQLQQIATATNLESLREKALQLQVADKFRLAALLVDQNKPHLASTIAKRAIDEIKLALLLE